MVFIRNLRDPLVETKFVMIHDSQDYEIKCLILLGRVSGMHG
jgi:hypothetical protein